jgi:L-arabinose isomerase
MSEVLQAQNEIIGLETIIADATTRLLELREFLRNSESKEGELRQKLVDAGFNEAAIQAALDAQLGKAVEAEPATERKTRTRRSEAECEAAVEIVERSFLLGPDNQSSEDIQSNTGLDKAKVTVALKALLEAGKISRTGKLRGTKYSFVAKS